jgi:hypothetical protein
VRLPPARRYRDFRLFTVGYLPAETGEYIHFVVQNWLAWELTHSAFSLGLLGFFEFAPRFIFGPIGGVIADRMNRLHLLVASRIANLLQTLVFAGLIFFDLIQFWHIVVLVIFMAIVSSFSTAAQQVLVVSLVPQEGVVSALALHSATHNLTKVIGPSIGGVLLTFGRPRSLPARPSAHNHLYAGRALQDAAAGRAGDCIHRSVAKGYCRGRFLSAAEPAGLGYDSDDLFERLFRHLVCSISAVLRPGSATGRAFRLWLARFRPGGRRRRGQLFPIDPYAAERHAAFTFRRQSHLRNIDFFLRDLPIHDRLRSSPRCRRRDANELSSARPGHHSARMPAPSARPGHEPLLPRSGLRLSRRALHRERCSRCPRSSGRSRQRPGVRSGFLAAAANRSKQDFRLIEFILSL